jgi:hypothetical protein
VATIILTREVAMKDQGGEHPRRDPPDEAPDRDESQDRDQGEGGDLRDDDFQFVLTQLLNAYQPILEEELARSRDPDRLRQEAQDEPVDCDREFALAERIFDRFFAEDVALRLLPPQARELLGPIAQWRWCLLHLRCCIIFGWLVCRGPRTFRGFIYYLFRYWLCVRRALGTPVQLPLDGEARQDLDTLVQALAHAYRPYLTDQLASVEFPHGLADELQSGRLDCNEGEEEAAAIFERFLTIETAQALLGREAFENHRQHPSFWFCRCWCLCAIRFGCCLARARSFVDIFRCLRFYRRCLRDCFRPLTCELTQPVECVEEESFHTPAFDLFKGVEVRGTAAGAFCSHYTLEWRESGTPTWRSDGVRYAGNPEPAQGVCGVVNGTLGYLTTYPFVPPGPVQVRVCVFSTQPGVAPSCCTTEFTLQRNLVWIRGIEGVEAAEPPGVLDPTAPLTDASGVVRAFGTAVQVIGTAWVGGCEDRRISRYTLSYHPGFVTDPLLPGFVQFWQVDYLNAFQIAHGQGNPINEGALTSQWQRQRICLPPPAGCFTIGNYLQPARWSTQLPQSFRVEPVDPPGTPNPPIWNSTPLPSINCQSGRYTLRLTVEDELGFVHHDLQQAWFDNKSIYGRIFGLAGVDPCEGIELRRFAVEDGDCSVEWPALLEGIAYDEYIEEGNTTVPSDNFEQYRLWIKKDGGAWHTVPIPGPGGSTIGTSRVGDPGVRCPTASPPAGSVPPETPGILTVLDMRRLDAVCNPGEPALTLERGECCGYIVWLQVRDRTICPSLGAGRHQVDEFFPLCICNDLPATEPAGNAVARRRELGAVPRR